MKSKIFRYVKFFLLFSGIVSTIVIFSLPSNLQTINLAGSSSVFSLIREYSSIYKKSDIIVQAGGSSVGVKSVINNSKEIGMVSKKPFFDNDIKNYNSSNLISNDLSQWKKYNIKTVTLAWDGIGIVYQSNSNQELIINNSNINKIHEIFSGLKKYKYHDIGVIGDFNEVIPFARTGGSNVSGTADAFLRDTGFKNAYDDLDENVKNILITGNYGENVKTTAEANVEAWNFFKDSKNNGKMIYLSVGFINNYKKEIEANGYKIAKYQFDNNSPIVLPDDNNITSTYNWYRPINIVFRLNENYQYDPKLINFISWMLSFDNNFNIINNEDINRILKKMGFIKLKEDQIKSMAKGDDLKQIWNTSDFDLGYCGAK